MRGGDADDILEIRGERTPQQGSSGSATRPVLTDTGGKKKKPAIRIESIKRPDGMKRELFNLLVHSDRQERIHSFAPTGTKAGYSVVKAQLGLRTARKWHWRTFVNPGNEKLHLQHWEREGSEGKPYPFSKYNKSQTLVEFSDAEYEEGLKDPGWTKAETKFLLELVQRFDMRWPVVQSRFFVETGRRSMEDIKERYYNVVNTLNVMRGTNPELLHYDADHERRRKEQLKKLLSRTNEEIKEEEELKAALKRIEASKARREKAAQDVQRLIQEASRHSLSPEGSTPGGYSSSAAMRQRKLKGRIAPPPTDQLMDKSADGFQIRFPEFRSVGPHLRSQEAKLPNNLGLKKLKNIDTVIQALKLDAYPDAFPEAIELFNTLRSNIVMLQNLKTALASAEADLADLSYTVQEEGGEPIAIEPRMRVSMATGSTEDNEDSNTGDGETKMEVGDGASSCSRRLTQLIDITPVTAGVPQVPSRKRRTRQYSPSSET